MPEQQQQPAPWDALRQRAADPNAAAFVNPESGQIEVFNRADLGDAQQKALGARGLKPASAEDIEKRATHLQNATTERQTQAAIELGLNTATFGGIGKEEFGEGATERREALEKESPGVALGARVVGGAIPMALSGGLASAAGAGAIGVGAAEGLGAGLAEESAQAAWEGRDLSAGNVALAGLGGALFAGAVPAVLRRGSKALSGPTDAVAAAAGEVSENLGPRLEAAANARAAKVASEVPPGPARDAILTQAAPEHLQRVTQDITDVATRAPESLVKSDLDNATLKRLMPRDSPAQTKWATDTAEQLRALAGRPAVVAEDAAAAAPAAVAKSPINLAGKSLEDLKALPIEGADDLARVKSLTEHEGFKATGRLDANDAKQGITLVDDGGELTLRDGRHRLKAAQETGRDSIYGRYVDGKTGKTIFEGEIPLKAANDTAPASGIRRTAKGARIGELRQGEGSPIDVSDWDMGDFAKGRGGGKAAGKNVHGYSGGDTVSQYQRSIVDGLKQNKEFASTGRISGDAGKLGSEPTIHVLPDSTLQLGHGRLRITAARELGLPEIYGRVMLGSGKDAKLVYEGMIPVGKRMTRSAEAAGSEPAITASVGHGDLLRSVSESLLESKGGLDTMQRARAALTQLRQSGAPQEAIDALQNGIRDQSLFGRAAEAMADFDAVNAKMPGSPLEGFAADNVTQEARQRLTAMAEALEDRAAARAKWDLGGAKDKASQRLVADAKRIKAGLGMADDVAGAEARKTATAAAAPGTPKQGLMGALGKEAIDYAKEAALDYLLPGSGLLRRGAKLLWSNVDAAGRESIRQAARSAARGAMSGVERAAGIAGKAAPTALETFTGDFSGPAEAFIARRQMLVDMQRDPTVLPNALAESLGDMPRENPKLFGQIAARMTRAVTAVTANLPPQVATSMTHPRGVPPSRDTLRDFAVVWNSAMHPETVIDAVEEGSCSPQQMRILEMVDPDTHAQLQTDIITELGQNYEQTTAQTKQWLDILFGSDGISGPSYSWKAAEYMYQGSQSRGNKPMPMTALPPPSEQAPNASGIQAIQKGVTNRGA